MPSNGSSAQSASLLLLLPALLLLLLLQLVQQKQKQQQLLFSLTRLYPSNVLACVTTPPAHSQAILRAMPPNATPPASPACLPSCLSRLAPRQLWILMAAASHVESPSSVAATQPPPPPPSVPRLAACIRDGIASCLLIVVALPALSPF